jgi:hypothetical protein
MAVGETTHSTGEECTKSGKSELGLALRPGSKQNCPDERWVLTSPISVHWLFNGVKWVSSPWKEEVIDESAIESVCSTSAPLLRGMTCAFDSQVSHD